MTNVERIYEYLTRLSRLLQSEERASEGMAPVQLEALLYLARANRYSDKPSAVAEYLDVTKGTASQTLGALERAHLIKKTADRNDGRGVRLSLTAKGRRVASARALPPSLSVALQALTHREVEQLHASLHGLLRAIQRSGRGRSFGVCHSCRHFVRQPDRGFTCGLTGEPLSTAEGEQICREHDPVTT